MPKIRVAVVGLRHGMASVVETLTNPDFELVALCSQSRDSYDYLCGAPMPSQIDSVTFTEPRDALIARCRALQDFGRIPFYESYDALLAHEPLDAVILAVPINLNAPYAVAALDAGKHVLASKPYALTLEDGLALSRAAERARGKFMLNFEFRYSPLAEAIREQLASGALGSLHLMWWNMFRMPFRAGYRKLGVSGGPFVAELCHWFDLFQLFNDETEFARICAFAGLDVNVGMQDFEDNGVCIVEYRNGVRASVNFSYFTDQPQHSLFGLVGSKGKLTGDTDDAGSFTLHNRTDRQPVTWRADPSAAHSGHLGFDVAHRRFSRVILDDQRINDSETKRGFESLLLGLAARESFTTGRAVTRMDLLGAQAR